MISAIEQSNQNEAGLIGRPIRNENLRPPVVIDLCCGLGGLSLAAQQLGMKVAVGVDLNSHALKTFEKNFIFAKAINGSVRSKTVLAECAKILEPLKKNRHSTVIVSGPPCQGFSAAGPRDPSDIRNKVLVAVANAIVYLQPSCALVENVSMLLSEDNEERVDTFEKILFEGGYSTSHLLLNASEFGVPQKRERAFFSSFTLHFF